MRVAHIASAKREPIFFELLGSDFFLGKHVRVSASRFWVGSRGPP